LRVTFWKLEAGGGDWSSGAEVGGGGCRQSRQASSEDHGDEA
jgi:hypothetical protein